MKQAWQGLQGPAGLLLHLCVMAFHYSVTDCLPQGLQHFRPLQPSTHAALTKPTGNDTVSLRTVALSSCVLSHSHRGVGGGGRGGVYVFTLPLRALNKWLVEGSDFLAFSSSPCHVRGRTLRPPAPATPGPGRATASSPLRRGRPPPRAGSGKRSLPPSYRFAPAAPHQSRHRRSSTKPSHALSPSLSRVVQPLAVQNGRGR